jgi:hypothetical protein
MKGENFGHLFFIIEGGRQVLGRRQMAQLALLLREHLEQGLAALSGLAAVQLEPLLSSLVRKEVLSIQADPRSPERGQYGFLQDLVRRVAYAPAPRPPRA